MSSDWDTDAEESAEPDDFGGGEVETGTAERIPPGALLAGACAALLLSAVAAIRGELATNVVGYILAAPVTFALVALYRRAATRRLFASGAATTRGQDIVSYIVVGLGFVASIIFAWLIARHYA